jgi:WD40 repeat protein/GTPase SAR1 family protein
MAQTTDFKYDVFLSHSSEDKPVVRKIAGRLRADGLRVWFDEWEILPGDSIPAKVEEGLEQSRVLVLCMSANAFGSDWVQLEADAFRFRDPLNTKRRFIPLRLDEAAIPGSFAQFLHISWLPQDREENYPKLLEACRPPQGAVQVAPEPTEQQALTLAGHTGSVYGVALSGDGRRALSGAGNGTVRVWDVESGRCVRVLRGHAGNVLGVALSHDGLRAISGSEDGMMCVWNTETGRCERVLEGHADDVWGVALGQAERRALSLHSKRLRRNERVAEEHRVAVLSVALSGDGRHALSGSLDNTMRMWDVETGRCERVLAGHTDSVWSVALSRDGRRGLSGSDDRTVRVWDVRTGRCEHVLEGHTGRVKSVALSRDGHLALSGADDKTVRVWDVETGHCERVLEGHTGSVYGVALSGDGRRALSGAGDGTVRVWDLSDLPPMAGAAPTYVENVGVTIRVSSSGEDHVLPAAPVLDQVQYTNAKVLLVGNSGAGKTGLSHRLATGEWKPTDGSTVGAWATQLKLSDDDTDADVSREAWLWDFGGQADQRLIHQLYMDRAALILLLFNAAEDEVLPGLRDWQTALQRSLAPETIRFLVAARIDAGFKASRTKLEAFADEHGLDYHETSAMDGKGCNELRAAVISRIPWDRMPKYTSPREFKLIQDEILKLRDEGQILHTFKELRALLWNRLPAESGLTDKALQAVIGLLNGPGVVKELDYGTYILLKPEWINAYAQAVLRTVRSDERKLGCLPLRRIAEGDLIYQSVDQNGEVTETKRLPRPEERVILGEMERQLFERGLCLRQGGKLVFPSHCGRERQAVVKYPSVFVSYEVKGWLDDVYATLAVKLADSEAFELKELWRDAADFDTLEGGHRMGIKLTKDAAGFGSISVYFGKGVSRQEQVIFANYIHAHLEESSEEVQRLRHWVCPKCNTPKGNPHVLMKKLLAKRKEADTECDGCGERFLLWDALEKRFASKSVREQVEALQAEDVIRLDSRRKGMLLVHEVMARIHSANQKCHEIPQEEDEGIDIEMEFTHDDGKGSGKRMYLQLKAGNSHLRRRKDGVETFRIKKQAWVKYWKKQPGPVMLVIGTFAEHADRHTRKDKLEFEQVRWMEISGYLKKKSNNGTKQVRSIEFKGEPLDLSNIQRLRREVLRDLST